MLGPCYWTLCEQQISRRDKRHTPAHVALARELVVLMARLATRVWGVLPRNWVGRQCSGDDQDLIK